MLFGKILKLATQKSMLTSCLTMCVWVWCKSNLLSGYSEQLLGREVSGDHRSQKFSNPPGDTYSFHKNDTAFVSFKCSYCDTFQAWLTISYWSWEHMARTLLANFCEPIKSFCVLHHF
jgi:hypothetical protein